MCQIVSFSRKTIIFFSGGAELCLLFKYGRNIHSHTSFLVIFACVTLAHNSGCIPSYM